MKKQVATPTKPRALTVDELAQATGGRQHKPLVCTFQVDQSAPQ